MQSKGEQFDHQTTAQTYSCKECKSPERKRRRCTSPTLQQWTQRAHNDTFFNDERLTLTHTSNRLLIGLEEKFVDNPTEEFDGVHNGGAMACVFEQHGASELTQVMLPSDSVPFAWAQDQHRSFVQAIFNTGMTNASPSVIIDQMITVTGDLTSERVKSHLQKYRCNKAKSTHEFMQEYDTWTNFNAVKFRSAFLTQLSKDSPEDKTEAAELDVINHFELNQLSGGERAACLTQLVMNEQELSFAAPFGKMSKPMRHPALGNVRVVSQDYMNTIASAEVPLPQLSKEERESNLGVWLDHTIFLLSSMSNQLLQQRTAQVPKENNPSQVVADSEETTLKDLSLEHQNQTSAPQHHDLEENCQEIFNFLDHSTSPTPVRQRDQRDLQPKRFDDIYLQEQNQKKTAQSNHHWDRSFPPSIPLRKSLFNNSYRLIQQGVRNNCLTVSAFPSAVIPIADNSQYGEDGNAESFCPYINYDYYAHEWGYNSRCNLSGETFSAFPSAAIHDTDNLQYTGSGHVEIVHPYVYHNYYAHEWACSSRYNSVSEHQNYNLNSYSYGGPPVTYVQEEAANSFVGRSILYSQQMLEDYKGSEEYHYERQEKGYRQVD